MRCPECDGERFVNEVKYEFKGQPIVENEVCERCKGQGKVEDEHSHTDCNLEEVMKSDKCACLYCKTVFNRKKWGEVRWVKSSVSNKATVLCSVCGVDAVIGDASGYPVQDREWINKLHNKWFGDMHESGKDMD